MQFQPIFSKFAKSAAIIEMRLLVSFFSTVHHMIFKLYPRYYALAHFNLFLTARLQPERSYSVVHILATSYYMYYVCSNISTYYLQHINSFFPESPKSLKFLKQSVLLLQHVQTQRYEGREQQQFRGIQGFWFSFALP